jgi:D-serine deaminase-like pyridoxal phosphate-dependent protein
MTFYPQHTIGMSTWDLDTPALVLDIGLAEQNLARMAEAARGWGKRLRPHVKTHKTPIVARMQVALGAIGVSAAKLGEAEAMILGGVEDVLLTTELVGERKIARLLALSRHGRLIGVIDDAGAAAAISEAFEREGMVHDVLVDVNVGQDRTGVEPGEPALALARRVRELKGLRFRGLQGYEGHLQHIYAAAERAAACREAMTRLCDTARLLRDHDLACEIVSTAGTGTAAICAEFPEVTELQPGSYVAMDNDYARVEGLQFANALTILSTVISRAAPDRAVLDAGHKASSIDAGMPTVKDVPGARYVRATDEHGVLTLEGEARKLKIGDRVELIPSHCDPTINLHDVFHVVRDGRLEAVWPIAARGKLY